MSKGISDPNHPLKDVPKGTIVHRRDDPMFMMRKRDVRALWRAKARPTEPKRFGQRQYWAAIGWAWTEHYTGEILRQLRALRGVGPVSCLSDRQ